MGVCLLDLRDFNPRSREGSDIEAAEPARSTNISIHAPVKGATPKQPAAEAALLFQSTLP